MESVSGGVKKKKICFGSDLQLPLITDAVSSKFIFELAEKYRFERPLLQMFWYPNMTFTKCHAYFVLLTVLCLAIPTNILDFFLDLFHVKIQ